MENLKKSANRHFDGLQNDRYNMQVSVKKLTLMAVLTALALIIFIIEAQIPMPIPVPGVKLGLANAVTLFVLFYGTGKSRKGSGAGDSDGSVDMGGSDNAAGSSGVGESGALPANLTTANAFTILLCRIVLGAVFTGRLVAFAYSITGGLLGFAVQVVMKRFVSNKQIWVCGAVGAVFHNIGQILAAVIITGTPAIVAYLPVLIIAGVVTGVLTGLVAQFTLEHLKV